MYVDFLVRIVRHCKQIHALLCLFFHTEEVQVESIRKRSGTQGPLGLKSLEWNEACRNSTATLMEHSKLLQEKMSQNFAADGLFKCIAHADVSRTSRGLQWHDPSCNPKPRSCPDPGGK